MNINFELKEEYNKNCISCITSTANEAEICVCKVGYDVSGSGWVISSWFTKEKYQNSGIGKATLQKVLACLYERFGKPDTIGYIWNGTNEYVLKWMEKHFDAKCLCPLAIQKTQSGYDWLSHMYDLDVDKVISYFNIKDCTFKRKCTNFYEKMG